MGGDLATTVADFLAHKRALGRKYLNEEATLRMLVAFMGRHGVTTLAGLTARLLDEFVASRPRPRDRSFNLLVGIVNSFLGWSVGQQRLEALPWQGTRRKVTDQRLPFLFDPSQVRRVLEAAAALPDNARAIGRGPTYHAIFALCYGLGLRAGEACGLRLEDIDAGRELLVVHGGGSSARAVWSLSARTSGNCSTSSSSAEPNTKEPARTHRCSPLTAAAACTPAPRAERSTGSSPSWGSRFPTGPRHRTCTACVIPSPSGPCCAGTGKALTPRQGSCSSRHSWATWTRPRPPSI